MTSPSRQSALIVEIPEAEPAVGRFAEVVVHLTVGHDCPVAELRVAEEAVRAELPIDGTVRAVSLLASGPGGRWRRRARFSLGR